MSSESLLAYFTLIFSAMSSPVLQALASSECVKGPVRISVIGSALGICFAGLMATTRVLYEVGAPKLIRRYKDLTEYSRDIDPDADMERLAQLKDQWDNRDLQVPGSRGFITTLIFTGGLTAALTLLVTLTGLVRFALR